MRRFLLILIALCWAAAAHAQTYGQLTKVITLVPATTITANTTFTVATQNLSMAKYGTCVLNVTAQSGTTPTLHVYVQGNRDGTNFRDYLAFAQVAAATPMTAIGFNATTAFAAATLTDATMSAGTAGAGPFGDALRVKAVVGGTTPSYTFSVICTVTG